MARRKQGSSIAAVVFGAALLLLALARVSIDEIPWDVYSKWIDVGASAIFGVVLLWWAASARGTAQMPNTKGQIGNETVTMIVAVVAAAVAVFTLTDAAATSRKKIIAATSEVSPVVIRIANFAQRENAEKMVLAAADKGLRMQIDGPSAHGLYSVDAFAINDSAAVVLEAQLTALGFQNKRIESAGH